MCCPPSVRSDYTNTSQFAQGCRREYRSSKNPRQSKSFSGRFLQLLQIPGQKCCIRLFPHQALRTENPVHQLPQPGKAELFRLCQHCSVGNDILFYPAAQRFYDFIAVIPKHDCIPKAHLITLIKCLRRPLRPALPFQKIPGICRPGLPALSARRFPAFPSICG